MRAFRFSKPKGPGYGLSNQFYLTVFGVRAIPPLIREWIDPKGAQGAVEGFGAPLHPGADQTFLTQPIRRGPWALASRDRKSVFRMLAMSPEDAGFTPSAFPDVPGLSSEAQQRIRNAQWLFQLKLESHDPDVFPTLEFVEELVIRMATLTDGVVADPLSQRYLLPDQVRLPARQDPRVDVREHVSFLVRPNGPTVSAYTAGFLKFALPELQIQEVIPSDQTLAIQFLQEAGQAILTRGPVSEGDRLGAFDVSPGGLDRRYWDGIPCLDLLPSRGKSVGEALRS